MNTKGKEFVVSVADFAFYINGVLACTGVTNLSSSISVSMQEQAVNAGKGNKKVFSYKYGRELTAELEAADWKLEYIALQAGSQISKGLKDSYSLNECVTLVAGKGTIGHTPLTGAKVGVELPNGTFVEVTADGTSIDLTSYGLTTEKVKCTYQYNANATTGSALKDVNRQFTELKTTAAASGSLGKGVFATLKDNMTSLSPLFGMGAMINTAIRGLKDMYSNVVNIDSAMTELKKVTDETDSAYSSFLTNASKRSVELGTTITDYVNSTANFARLGYSMADATQLSEVANIYSVVGDEISGIDEASSSVISTMQAFGIQANDAISIVDKFNEVGNRFAISSGGIGDALTRSASSMAAANNTLDETIALITAANTVVQDAPRVGNAFKTISMRIRGATTELEEAGLETDGMAESTAKLQAEIKALSGVDIMLDKNTFKSTYQIMDELSQKWKDLTDIQQASITELLAGKHQGNVMASLMENFDIARQALDVSMNSEGSAMQEHEKYMDSIEARVNQLKAAWEGLSNSFLDSGFVKGAVSGLTEIAEAITTVIDHIGTLGTIGAGVGIVALIKNFGKEFALYGCESIDA